MSEIPPDPRKEVPDLRKEVIELAAGLCDDTLDDAQFARLESLLLENAEARSIYLDFMNLHLNLKDRGAVGQDQQGGSRLGVVPDEPAAEFPPVPDSLSDSGANYSLPLGSFRCPETLGGFVLVNLVWLLVLGTAMAAGSIVTGIAFSSSLSQPREAPASDSPTGADSGEPGPVEWKFDAAPPAPTDPPLPVTAELALWLSADREVYADLRKNPPHNGQKVVAWNDRARGVCASQGSALEQPVWLDAAVSVGPYECRPALRFSGRQSLHANMLADVLRGEDRPATIFTVVRFNEYDEPRRQSIVGWGRIGDKATLYQYGTTAPEDEYHPSNAFFAGRRDAEKHERMIPGKADGVTRDRLFVLSAVDTGKAVSMRANGRTVIEEQDVDVGILEYDCATIGAIPYAGIPRAWFRGDLAEVIVYSRALEPDERETVERYLMEKYGLAATNRE